MWIKVRCPNCKEQTQIFGTHYDEDIEEGIECSHCKFTTAKWCFEFVSSAKDYAKQAIKKLPVDEEIK